MKSKYFLALLLAGLPPIILLTGVYFWMGMSPGLSTQKAINPAVVQTRLAQLQTEVKTLASTMLTNLQKVYNEVPTLSARNSDTDLDNFVKSHPGVTGAMVLSTDGKVERNIPVSPPLADDVYGTSEEFQKIISKLQESGGATYQFYSQRLGYPSFVFAVSVGGSSIVEVIVNLESFFKGVDLKGGEYFLLNAGSGNYYYHSDSGKLSTPFNPNQEEWLAKVQADLSNQLDGTSVNQKSSIAVYAPLFKPFGVVCVVPYSVLQPPQVAREPSALSFPKNLADLRRHPMSIAAIASLLWILFFGFALRGMVLSPLRKAGVAILNAAHGSTSLTPEVVKRFGHDEVGQIVQASSILLQNLEEEKKKFAAEREEELRKGQALVEQKTKEAESLVSAAQQQAQQLKQELNDKSQHLNDKLKELDALKGMSEGLRNQSEQAKTEVAKLKSQTTASDEIQKELNQKLAQTQDQLKQMEVKLFSTVAASSAINVSQVRAAAIRTMAEELKTTLGIIKGYVSSALGTTQGGINEKQQEFLGMVINRAARLEKFINDLLDIYQVEIEQAEAKYEEVNLAAEIEGLAFNFQPQVEVKNVKLKIEAKPNLPKVPIVRRRFNQLWNILYLQIIKDAPRGSGITISVEPIGETIKVTVPDPGLTVASESLPKLFDEFYDPKHPASPQLAGTGLKFALVKTILAAHGGGAVAEKGDPGTKLLLTFPVRIKKPGEALAAASPAASSLGTGMAPAVVASPASKTALPFTLGPKPVLAPPSFGAAKPQAGSAFSAPLPGTPKSAVPFRPVTDVTAAAPKPAEAAPSLGSQSGILDALISKIPPSKEPDLKPIAVAQDEPATPKLVVSGASTTGVPATPSSTGMGKTPTTSDLLDSLLEKKTGGGLAPSAKPAGSPLSSPVETEVKPMAIPPSPSVGLPKPSIPPAHPTTVPPFVASSSSTSVMAGGLDALLEKKPVPPALNSIPPSGSKMFPGMPPKPTTSTGTPMPPPVAPKPPAPGAIPPSSPIPPASPMSGPPKPPLSAPGGGSGPVVKPPIAPIPPIAGPAAGAQPKVVPTSIKPTVPPVDLLKFDSTDSFKMDAKTGMSSTSPEAKPAIPMPPPGNKSIVKDLNKEGEGDLIE